MWLALQVRSACVLYDFGIRAQQLSTGIEIAKERLWLPKVGRNYTVENAQTSSLPSAIAKSLEIEPSFDHDPLQRSAISVANRFPYDTKLRQERHPPMANTYSQIHIQVVFAVQGRDLWSHTSTKTNSTNTFPASCAIKNKNWWRSMECLIICTY